MLGPGCVRLRANQEGDIKRIGLGLVFAAVALAAGAPAASAGPSTGPCGQEYSFTHPGRSKYEQVQIPSIKSTTAVANSYDGLLARPRHFRSRKQRVPGVVLLHGNGGTKCSPWWAARLLASRGYIAATLTFGSGDKTMPPTVAAEAATAGRSAIKYLISSADPYRSHLRARDLGLVGHSQGGMGGSVVQRKVKRVRAFVGLDNLRRWVLFDPGAIGCVGPAWPVAPRVPGLGVGSETGCLDDADLTDKLAGYHVWRSAGIPAMEAVLEGTTHSGFGGFPYNASKTDQLERSGYYMRAWLDRWLRGRKGAVKRLLSPTPMGIPIDEMLSDNATAAIPTPAIPTAFNSAAFLPGIIDCEDLRACL